MTKPNNDAIRTKNIGFHAVQPNLRYVTENTNRNTYFAIIRKEI